MKCLILAGGRGERLWPLSRKNYPKQFIQIQKNHSIFQETVARNIPYCDEFIIVTSYEYRYIIESQMATFQGIVYRRVYEGKPCGTAAAITLACMSLQPSELVFVVAADQLIDATGESTDIAVNYKDAIMTAKHYATNGRIVVFGVPSNEPETRYGWIEHEGDKVLRFIPRPTENAVATSNTLQNAGLLLFENGVVQAEIRKYSNEQFSACYNAFLHKTEEECYDLYSEEILKNIHPNSIEEQVLKKSNQLSVVICGFQWKDVGKLEDIPSADFSSKGLVVKNDTENTVVINNSSNQAVVINGAENLMVVNTDDAVYIGKYGNSTEVKSILLEHSELKPYSDKGTLFYRSWGYYQQLYGEARYRIRRVVIYDGKTIYAHSHKMRSENWTVVQGKVSIILDGVQSNYNTADNIDIPIGTVHQISNIGTVEAILVETACGEIIHEPDMIGNAVADVSENQLGIVSAPFVKLSPAFKDYLWGGTKLRDVYGKKCDYDIIAESWELSAHHAGQSIVASGRHKGMLFGQYLETVGREVLGWKCQSMTDFPLLIKFIDAKENLSIQVHPNDDYALENEHEYGKNEMWYILDCEEGASLYVGFNRDVSREEVEKRLKGNTILEILNKVTTHPGDVFFIPAGTVHAIGAGNLICEIQQSSNCTYRLYDYDRRDKYGNPRELHLQKALDVLKYEKYEGQELIQKKETARTVICECKYFGSSIYEVDSELVITMDDSRFLSVVCLSGNGTVTCQDEKQPLYMGESVFVKAQYGQIVFKGYMKLIISHI